MLFNSAIFAIFFAAFFFVFRFFAKTNSQRIWLILLGSGTFYAAWNYRFVPLLFGTALIDFFLARAIQHEPKGSRRRVRLLTLSIVVNLGVLAFFKYANFIIAACYDAVGLVSASHPIAPVLPIILPAGISFYTFQSMSYTIDVFRCELSARERPRDFLAAVSFFPHLVAGPIIRASTLLPQFEDTARTSWRDAMPGFMYLSVGLFNKTIADLLAGPANAIFTNPGVGSLRAWTGALAFTGQIYGDFAGYSDIAIGIALLLGFTLPKNFHLPYVASSPSDFWRRWHISLSTWLRDYLYIPLGGNRSRRNTNLFLTMLLGGLWHGANWTFIAWGAYHGLLLVIYRVFSSRFPREGLFAALGRLIARPLTFYWVVIGWVLFRADTIHGAARILRNMHTPGSSTIDHNAVMIFALVIGGIVLCHAVSYLGEATMRSRFGSIVFWPLVLVLLTLAIVFGGNGRAFIYFQF